MSQPSSAARTWQREELPEDLAELVAALDQNPTYVVGARWDVLHANPAAERVFTAWSRQPRERRNLLWYYCADPAARELFIDWEAEARLQLAHFRCDYDRFPGDPAFQRLLDRVTAANPLVQQWWDAHAHHETPRARGGVKTVRLATDRVVSLRQLVLASVDDPDVKIITYFADLDDDEDAWDDPAP